jgi:hypothetical protein
LKHHYSRSNFGTAGGAGFSHNNPHFSKNDTQGILINKVDLPPKPKFFSDFVKEETEKIKKQQTGGGAVNGGIVPGNQQQDHGA